MSPRPAPPPDLAGRWLAKFFTDHLAGERAASPGPSPPTATR